MAKKSEAGLLLRYSGVSHCFGCQYPVFQYQFNCWLLHFPIQLPPYNSVQTSNGTAVCT